MVLGVPSRRSMLGPQANSQLHSAPSYGFGSAERAENNKLFISKDMVTDKYGMSSPGPVYRPTGMDGRYHTAPSHSFGVSHRHTFGKKRAAAKCLAQANTLFQPP